MMPDITTLNSLPDLITEVARFVDDHSLSYMEAVLHYCDVYGLEIEVVGEEVKRTPLLRARLQLEAEDLNFLKKSARLPI